MNEAFRDVHAFFMTSCLICNSLTTQEVVMSKQRNERSSKTAGDHRTTVLADVASATREEPVAIDEVIRMRAYELYLERGDEPSDSLNDWLRAERELYEPRREEDGATRTAATLRREEPPHAGAPGP
jgi:hypothetical protein